MTLPGTWLVMVPAILAGEDIVAACARALADRGATVVTAQTAADADRAALAAQVGQALDGADQVSGVVSLLALAEEPLAAYPAVAAGLAGTQALVQALGDAGVAAPLWALTRGAVAAGPGDRAVSPAQAQVWGLGRVAGLEHPERWGGLVDVPATLDERAAALLCGVLAAGTEDQVAIRSSGAVARRLSHAGPQSPGAAPAGPRVAPRSSPAEPGRSADKWRAGWPAGVRRASC